jgi:Fe2+ transport system protein FeoA
MFFSSHRNHHRGHRDESHERHRQHHHGGNGAYPLALASPGEKVRLVAVHGGRTFRKRLADLGLNIGMDFEIVQHDGFGPLILGVKGSRLMIGRGMAHRIFVEPVA